MKRQKLETDCTSFKKENENLHTVTKKQAKTIVSLKTGKKGYRLSKQWSDYNRAYRSVKKKQVVSGMSPFMMSSLLRCQWKLRTLNPVSGKSLIYKRVP